MTTSRLSRARVAIAWFLLLAAILAIAVFWYIGFANRTPEFSLEPVPGFANQAAPGTIPKSSESSVDGARAPAPDSNNLHPGSATR